MHHCRFEKERNVMKLFCQQQQKCKINFDNKEQNIQNNKDDKHVEVD